MPTNATAAKPKKPADYAKLADETELILDGLRARDDRLKAHLNTMLKAVPERAAIMLSFERFAVNKAQLVDVQARRDRYIALRDRPADSTPAENTAS